MSVQREVHTIYLSALAHARATQKSPYYYMLPSRTDGFYSTYMKDILAGLKERLPECSVVHTLLASGTDGTLYDIQNITDDILPLVNAAHDNSYIVIRWP